MVILDGKQLQKKLREDMKSSYDKLGEQAHLAIVIVGSDAASKLFVQKKVALGKDIGVKVNVHFESEDISTVELCERIKRIAEDETTQGIIVQLPLPGHIDTRKILDAIPLGKDVDMLSMNAVQNYEEGKSLIAPPVIGAIEAFIEEYKIDTDKKHVVIVGEGKLVGCPAILWAEGKGLKFTVISEETDRPSEILKTADIIISGVGKANMITGDMVKNGAIIFDAGISTGEFQRVLGDVQFDSVSEKVSFITPVPGGIGPVTVAIVFQNLLKLIAQR